MDTSVINHAPDADIVTVKTDNIVVIIERDESGEVFISVKELDEGSEMRIVLGKVGFTHVL